MNEYEMTEMEKEAAKMKAMMDSAGASLAAVYKKLIAGGKAKGKQLDKLVQRLGGSVGKGGRKVTGGRLSMGDLRKAKTKRMLGYGTVGTAGTLAAGGGYAASKSKKSDINNPIDRLNALVFDN